jgi:hypothetical protein
MPNAHIQAEKLVRFDLFEIEEAGAYSTPKRGWPKPKQG